MKSNRKYVLWIVLSTLFAATCLVACNGGNGESHTHTYGDGWEHDQTYHWHAATCDHAQKTADKAVHTFESVKVDPTCTTDGYTEYTCTCGYSYRADTVEKSGHDYRTTTVEPTHGVEGYVLHRCAVCGDEYKTDTKPALEHNFIDRPAVPATCGAVGHGAYKVCTVCGYQTESEMIPTSEHTYSTTAWGFNADAHWRPAVCGHNARTAEAEHEFVDGVCECGYRVPVNVDADKFSYKRNAFGYTITGIKDPDVTSVMIPLQFGGLNVTAIADNAFIGNTTLTRVTFSGGFESIGAYAFEGCTALESVKMPTTLQVLGEQAFNGCVKLTAITVPSGVKRIEKNTFLHCEKLAAVTLPDTLTHIGAQAFAGCTELAAIELKDGLEKIGQSAFKDSGLEEIELPASVGYVGAYAFRNCKSLTRAILSAKIEYAVDNWFAGCESLQELTLPFVGNHVDPDKATSKVLGYVFGTAVQNETKFNAVEQGGKTYYIPKSLTKVTVLGGTVDNGSFENCTGVTVVIGQGATDTRG